MPHKIIATVVIGTFIIGLIQAFPLGMNCKKEQITTIVFLMILAYLIFALWLRW